MTHQSLLLPEQNKFHCGNGADGKHYWITPPDLYAKLDAEFHFDFDPCPYPLPQGFDGLTCDWGNCNWVNPPFGSIVHQGKKKGPTAWVRKAIEENRKGKLVVMVYPVDKWVLMLLSAIMCHTDSDQLCRGWLDCHDKPHLLALRLAASFGHIDRSIFDLEPSGVPVFASGAKAARHGMRRIKRPTARARRQINKIASSRARSGTGRR